MARTTFYVTVQPTFNRYDDEKLESIRAIGVTQNKPNRLSRQGTVSVKLTLDIPDGAFLPMRPEAIVVVPEEMAKQNLPVNVIAVEQDDDEREDES